MTLGDRVAVMRAGVLQQVDTPKELYDDPVNLFVAGFIGSPAMNFFPAHGRGRHGSSCRSSRCRCRRRCARRRRRAGGDADRRHAARGLRGRRAVDDRRARGHDVRGPVDLVEAMGSEFYAHFGIERGRRRRARSSPSWPPTPAPPTCRPRRGLAVARLEPATKAQRGQSARSSGCIRRRSTCSTPARGATSSSAAATAAAGARRRAPLRATAPAELRRADAPHGDQPTRACAAAGSARRRRAGRRRPRCPSPSRSASRSASTTGTYSCRTTRARPSRGRAARRAPARAERPGLDRPRPARRSRTGRCGLIRARVCGAAAARARGTRARGSCAAGRRSSGRATRRRA